MSVEIKCRSCKASVQVENVNLDRMLAKCTACNSVFDISTQVPHAAAPYPAGGAPPRRERGNLPMPKGMDVEWGGSMLQITSKWKSSIGFFFGCAFALAARLCRYFLAARLARPVLEKPRLLSSEVAGESD